MNKEWIDWLKSSLLVKKKCLLFLLWKKCYICHRSATFYSFYFSHSSKELLASYCNFISFLLDVILFRKMRIFLSWTSDYSNLVEIFKTFYVHKEVYFRFWHIYSVTSIGKLKSTEFSRQNDWFIYGNMIQITAIIIWIVFPELTEKMPLSFQFNAIRPDLTFEDLDTVMAKTGPMILLFLS